MTSMRTTCRMRWSLACPAIWLMDRLPNILARKDLGDRFGFLASRVPDLYREDDAAPPRIVVEYDLDRCV